MSDITDLQDMLTEEATKLSFLGDVFAQETEGEFRFSDNGQSGLFFILREIETRLKHVNNTLGEICRAKQKETV
jgi:hypothetical protein